MPRVIRFFKKINEEYAGEFNVPDIDVNILRKQFGIKNAENPIYDSYPIKKEDGDFFNTIIVNSFDFDKFDYFLDYDA